MYTDLQVKEPLYLSDFSETYIFWADFQKIFSNIKFHENPSKWEPSRYMQKDGRTDGRTDRRTDMTKFIFALRNFANARYNIDKAQLTLL
jgi:hypothetical protein